MSRKHYLFVFLAAIAVSFVLYSNTIPGDYVQDDAFFHDRVELRHPKSLLTIWSEPMLPGHPEFGTYRPVATLSFALNYIISGESPAGFHIVNILLNAGVAFLLFYLMYLLFSSAYLAGLSALIFSFLPVHTEVVANIKSRDEILSAFFLLAAWILLLWGLREKEVSKNKLIFWMAGALSFYLAVLSKEMAIVAPFLFIFVFYVRREINFRRDKLMLLILCSAVLLAIGTRYSILGGYAFGGDELPYASNPLKFADNKTALFTAFKIAFLYIGKTLVPAGLSATHHYNHVPLVTELFGSPEALTGILLLSLLGYFAFSADRRSSPAGIGAAIFLISYSLISRFVLRDGGDIMAERWMYFPSAGIAIIIASGIVFISRNNKIFLAGIMIPLLAVYGYLTFMRNKVWLSAESLIASMVRDAPESVLGYMNYGLSLVRVGEYDKAKPVIEFGLSIEPYNPFLMALAGKIFYEEGQLIKASAIFEEIIKIAPNISSNFLYLARINYDRKNYKKSAEYFTDYSGMPDAKWTTEEGLTFAEALIRNGQYGKALELLEGSYGGSRRTQKAEQLLAVSYYLSGNLSTARHYFSSLPGLTEAQKIGFIRSAYR